MTPLADVVQQAAAVSWLFIPSAILLGALHGLEPGHSKTMMAAFIVAIRGSVAQAALLAVTATISHTAVVWLVAILALTYGSQWSAATTEPYFELASGALIIGIAVWMLFRTYRDQRAASAAAAHTHDVHAHAHGTRFVEHGHGHDHNAPDTSAAGFQDPHQRAHELEIRNRFANRNVSTGQVALFGLTGGLLPCPAAVTVLLLCLQLKEFWLGITLVLCFSIGLALTLLAAGVAAAWGTRHASQRWPGFETLARQLPYLSSAIIICMGLYVGVQGWMGLAKLSATAEEIENPLVEVRKFAISQRKEVREP